MNEELEQAMIDYVATARSIRQHAATRQKRYEADNCPEAVELIEDNRRWIEYLDREITEYEKRLGWRAT